MSLDVPKKWDATKIASQKNKVAIVTGANSGIGFVTALELARHGADVVLACRSEDKGKNAVSKIEEELKLSPEAGKVEFRKLDVSSLSSVETFSEQFKASHNRLDLLVNNAGIMAVPYAETADGIESQFATNHLGHFALTARLFDLLKQSQAARVVNVSSLLHRDAEMDLNAIVTPKNKYKEMPVYRITKLYNLLFSFELNRRLRADGVSNVIATTAHPGLTETNLAGGMLENSGWFTRLVWKIIMKLPMVGTPETGALPLLYAATGENVVADDYFGPDGMGSTKGFPTKEEPRNVSKSQSHATKLWEESERLAGIKFHF